MLDHERGMMKRRMRRMEPEERRRERRSSTGEKPQREAGSQWTRRRSLQPRITSASPSSAGRSGTLGAGRAPVWARCAVDGGDGDEEGDADAVVVAVQVDGITLVV